MAVPPCPDHCVSVMTALSAQRLSGSPLCDLTLVVHVPPSSPASAAAASGRGATGRGRGASGWLCRAGAGGAGAGGAGETEGVGGSAEEELAVLLPCHRAVLAACSPLFRDAVAEARGDAEGGGGVTDVTTAAGTAGRWGRVWGHGDAVANEAASAEGDDRATAGRGSDFDAAVGKEERTDAGGQAAFENDAAGTEGPITSEEGEKTTTDANVVKEGEQATWTDGGSQLKEEEADLKDVETVVVETVVGETVVGETALGCYAVAENRSQGDAERGDPSAAATRAEDPGERVGTPTGSEAPPANPSSPAQWTPRLRPGASGRWLCELPPTLGPVAVSRLLDFAYRGRLDAAAARDRHTLLAAKLLHMSGAVAAFMEPENVEAAGIAATPCNLADVIAVAVDGDCAASGSSPDETRGIPAARRGRPRGRPRTVPVLGEDPRAADGAPVPMESNEGESPAKTPRPSRKMPAPAEPAEERAKSPRAPRKAPAAAKPADDPPRTPRAARKVPVLVEEAKEDLLKSPRASRKAPALAETKQQPPAKVVPRAVRKVPAAEEPRDECPPAAKVPRADGKASPLADQPELPGCTAADASLQDPQELRDENDGATMNVASVAGDVDGATEAGADGHGATLGSATNVKTAEEEEGERAAAEDAGDGRNKTASRRKAEAAANRSRRPSGQRLRRPKARTPGGGDPRTDGENPEGDDEKRPKSEPGAADDAEASLATSPTSGKREEKRHQCAECSKSYTSRKQLELHASVKHRNEGLCMCDMCGLTLGTRQGLQMHIKTQHRDERTFVCEFCGQRYGQRTGLMIHRRKHTGERPFPCSVCGKDFMSRGTLAKHQRTHTGERPFPCDRCGRGFADRGSLVRHEQSVHSDGPLLSCTLCYKSFKSGDQLRAHLRRHTGQRKFNCSLCEYKFTRQAHLRRHMEVHGRITDYCPQTRRLRTTGPGSKDGSDTTTDAAATTTAAAAGGFTHLQLQQHLPPGTALGVPVAGQPSLLTYTITPAALSASQSLALAVDLLNEEVGEVAVEEVEELSAQEQLDHHHQQQQQLFQLQQEENEEQVAAVTTVAGGDDPGVALLLKLAEQNPGDVFVLMQS